MTWETQKNKALKLAYTRTGLAIARTLLAHFRTSLAFIMAGIVLVHYLTEKMGFYFHLGCFFLVFGVLWFIIGIYMSYRVFRHTNGLLENDENPPPTDH